MSRNAPDPPSDAPDARRESVRPTDLRERIRAAGHRIGFDQVGFAPAEPPAHAGTYLGWLERGLHGEMEWMAREDAVRRRLDPREAMPGCRTLVAVSLFYDPMPRAGLPALEPGADDGESDRSGEQEAGRASAGARRLPVIARYAAGRDYHDVFEEKLDALRDAIRALAPGASTKRYVDYGPVLERDHAQRAGLGWIGKNTMLIHPRRGSYSLLGELLTDLELEPDAAFEPDRCGTCRRCIDACPTGAILEGRVVDSRRCISYLTIELRGPIPRELRPAIGNHVFGCDICQDVCPFNVRFAQEATEPGYAARGPGQPPVEAESPGGEASAETNAVTVTRSLVELMRMTRDDWDAFSRGSAIRRARYAGFKRNVAVALGNWLASVDEPQPKAVAALVDGLADEEPLVRQHAAWALGRIATPEARRALSRALERESDDRVRREMHDVRAAHRAR